MSRNHRTAGLLASAVAVAAAGLFPARAGAVGVCDVPLIGSVCDAVGGAAGGAAGAVADGALGALTGWVCLASRMLAGS